VNKVDLVVEAALDGDALKLRSFCQDLLREKGDLYDCPAPTADDKQKMAIAASLVELLAIRTGQIPPIWTEAVEGLAKPIYLLKSAEKMSRLRNLCESESPEPLRKRGLLAPPNFLSFA
jgi:hypothetical protein